MANTFNFPRPISEARPFEVEALEAFWAIPSNAIYYGTIDAVERLEAVHLNTDASVGISVAFLVRAPNNDYWIEIMVRDVSGEWAHAGWLAYSFHDDPASDGGRVYRIETASMNSHYLVSFDNGASRVNFGLSAYGVAGVGSYSLLMANAVDFKPAA